MALLQLGQAQVTEIGSEDQDNSTQQFSNWKDRIVVGGYVSAGFGNVTFVDVAPIAGYHLTRSLVTGVGFSYQYYKQNYDNLFFGPDYQGSIIGGRLYAEYDLFYGLFAHAEYEQLWYNFKFEDASLGEYKGDVPALYLGGGYNIMMGPRSKFQIMLLYDVLNTNESLHEPLSIRMGFAVGL